MDVLMVGSIRNRLSEGPTLPPPQSPPSLPGWTTSQRQEVGQLFFKNVSFCNQRAHLKLSTASGCFQVALDQTF